MWQDLYIHSISAGNFFCKAWKLFSAEIWKISECHFWANVMLIQPRCPVSRASSAQKLWGLRMVLSQKLFKCYKFDKKVQCEAVLSVVSLISKLVWTYSIVIVFFKIIQVNFSYYWIFFPGFLEKRYCLTIIRFKMCQNEIQIIASPAFLREVAHWEEVLEYLALLLLHQTYQCFHLEVKHSKMR